MGVRGRFRVRFRVSGSRFGCVEWVMVRVRYNTRLCVRVRVRVRVRFRVRVGVMEGLTLSVMVKVVF